MIVELNEPATIFTLVNVVRIAAVLFAVFFTHEGIKLSVEARRWARYGVTNHVRFLRRSPDLTFSKVYGHFWIVPTAALIAVTFYPPQPLFQGLVVLSSTFALIARFIWTGYFFSEKPGGLFRGR
jgi:hypothetical protein